VPVATIDIGTNTVLLLVAARDERGQLVALQEEAEITRLGQGVDKTKRLAPEAIARTSAALLRYAGIVRAHGCTAVDVVGTSAMRDAGGSEELRALVQRELGVPARTISGDEEARLTFRGALSGLPRVEGPVVVFDIGGGSTEIVLGEGDEIRFATSVDIGSVRLTERLLHGDPPTAEELAAALEAARAAFAGLPRLDTAHAPVGIAGTMTTLAAVSMKMKTYDGARVHGSELGLASLTALVRDLASMPLEARRKVDGLEPKRADVIIAGGLVATAVLERLGKSSARISDRGVRWGLAESLAPT
jgi:exopolyphosphatase/guanosine-5'-triphosphate,3'-diphosphate pyrophosphatase